jgi:hypothetical protein
VEKTDSAIDREAAAKGRTWVKTEAETADFIAEHLFEYDVLLVYTQNQATDSDLHAVGNTLYSVLNTFVTVGGIIVFTDGLSGPRDGTYVIFESADMFTADGLESISGFTTEVVLLGDAVAQGLNTSYLAVKDSVRFVTEEGPVVVQDPDTGLPVVVHKIFAQ